MAVKLTDTALPKTRSGRKAAELDSELSAALVKELGSTPTKELDGEQRPRALGSDQGHDTHGRAASAGRRYANHVSNELGKTVRVSVYSAEENKPPYFWRIYIPLSESQDGNAPAES